MPRNFVIVGTQRTGTTWLRTLLDSHPSIHCFGEVLNLDDVTEASYPKYVGAAPGRKLRHWLHRSGLLDEYLDQLLQSDSGTSAGFKLMYSMTSWYPYQFPMVLAYVRRRDLAVIHLTRQDVFRTHLSRVTARARKLWHTDKTLGARPPVAIPTATLLKSLRTLSHQDLIWRRKLAEFQPLSISYEDLVDNFDVTTGQILAYLDADSEVALNSNLKKINSDELHDVIENFEDVRDVLAGSEFAALLEDRW